MVNSAAREADVADHTVSSPASTWDTFWAARADHRGAVHEDTASLQTVLAAQIEWLSDVLNLVASGLGSERIGVEMRRSLGMGPLNDGTINASIAAVLAKHFWPHVRGSEEVNVRAEYNKLNAVRPPTAPGRLHDYPNGEMIVIPQQESEPCTARSQAITPLKAPPVPLDLSTEEEKVLADQRTWLVQVLGLLPTQGTIQDDAWIDSEIRDSLQKGRVTEATINAAVANILSTHFWPRVTADHSHKVRAAYKELSKLRPPARYVADLKSSDRDLPDMASDNSDLETVSQDILDDLIRDCDLAIEDESARQSAVSEALRACLTEGLSVAAARQRVFEKLQRLIAREQDSYRVNAKRGLKTSKAIWRVKSVAAICGCRGCQATRLQSVPWLSGGNPMSPSFELLQALKTEVRAFIPRKYVDVLRLDEVVADDVARDESAQTCHVVRVSRMAALVDSLFDGKAASPAAEYSARLSLHISPRRGRVPEPRQMISWQAAEENAAAWMRSMGFADARVTDGGADGGIDVISSQAVAQVKRESVAVGSPTIQRFHGAAAMNTDTDHKMFFSGAGYSKSAEAAADKLGIALFIYMLDGEVKPVNALASALLTRTVLA